VEEEGAVNLTFTVNQKPIAVNHAYAPAVFGRGPKKRHGFIKSEAAKQYQSAVRMAAIIAGARKIGKTAGPVFARIAFVWPTEAGDIDGPIKLTLDAMQGVVYENDRQVKRLEVERRKDPLRPRVEIHVEDLPGTQLALEESNE
jgi:Holliday junction resolvase RusA-like endonuclease